MANVIIGQGSPTFQGQHGPAVNVWVVDDDGHFRELLIRTLSTEPDLNCSRQFSSAPLLLAALRLPPAPDVILLDFQMPEMTGIEALPHIKKLAPATAVLILSTFLDYQRQQLALAAGARGYFCKAEPAAHLKAAIRAAQKNPPSVPDHLPPPPTAFAKLRQLFGGS